MEMTMKKTFRRATGLLLAVIAIAFIFLPVSVFAEEIEFHPGHHDMDVDVYEVPDQEHNEPQGLPVCF